MAITLELQNRLQKFFQGSRDDIVCQILFLYKYPKKDAKALYILKFRYFQFEGARNMKFDMAITFKMYSQQGIGALNGILRFKPWPDLFLTLLVISIKFIICKLKSTKCCLNNYKLFCYSSDIQGDNHILNLLEKL